ncbi:MAG: hypothetical protein PWK00_03650 [Coxiella burnetii]|nr:hypothetical protein [Coxiella burnetii]
MQNQKQTAINPQLLSDLASLSGEKNESKQEENPKPFKSSSGTIKQIK